MTFKVGDRLKVVKRLDVLFNTYNVGEVITLVALENGAIGIEDDHLSLIIVDADGNIDPVILHFKKIIRLRSA